MTLGLILRDVALLLLGWALGILSSPITDAIRRRVAKQRLTRALRTEMRSLQDSLAGVVINIARRRGVLTRPLLEAMSSLLKASGHVPGQGKAVRTIDGLLESELVGTAGAATPDVTPNPRAPLSVRVYGAPFLDSHFHRLDLYSLEVQRMLVEIHAELQTFNQHAADAMSYHQMTLGNAVSGDHLEALAANLESSYEHAAEKASDLVSRIAVLLREPEMRDA